MHYCVLVHRSHCCLYFARSGLAHSHSFPFRPGLGESIAHPPQFGSSRQLEVVPALFWREKFWGSTVLPTHQSSELGMGMLMLTRARRCTCQSMVGAQLPSFQIGSFSSGPRSSLHHTIGTLPRSSYQHNSSTHLPVVSRSYLRQFHHRHQHQHQHLTSASSRLAGSQTPKSRGPRILSPCRSSPTSATTFYSFSSHNITIRRNFSGTPAAMTATKIDGTAIAKSIRERLHTEIEKTQKSNPRYKPSLKIIQGRQTVPHPLRYSADFLNYSG